LVTGATSGIGLATARALARQGATLISVGRDPEKGSTTVAEIRQETGNPAVEFMLADLSVLDQVRGLVDEFQGRHDRLHVLINNAGGFFLRRRESADGIEMTFALNYLSPFLLTNLLLETLTASAPSRIVNVSSAMHKIAQIDLEDLEGKRRYSGAQAYGHSKLALLLFTYELARRLEGMGVTANAVHPGWVATKIGLGSGALAKILTPFMRIFASSPKEGAETSVYLASSPEVEGVSGKYWVDKEAVASSPASYDEAMARRLWEIGAEMTGL
jgi:NAD(P)-dependent dehydrogenase (short-subunit alcohol dehydrogenase family)